MSCKTPFKKISEQKFAKMLSRTKICKISRPGQQYAKKVIWTYIFQQLQNHDLNNFLNDFYGRRCATACKNNPRRQTAHYLPGKTVSMNSKNDQRQHKELSGFTVGKFRRKRDPYQ